MSTNKSYAEEMTDRYVYDVIRRLPRKSRADIEAELRTLIEDMLAEKAGDPSEADVDFVLLELGRPAELAAKYRGEPKFLIGPEYYDAYTLLLRIVLAATVFGMLLAQILAGLTSGQPALIGTIAAALAATLSAAIQAFGMVTVIFVIIERFSGKAASELAAGLSGGKGGKWYPGDLPPLPQASKQISPAGPVGSIIFTILVIVFFCFAPQVLGVFTFDSGTAVVPIFNLAHLRSALYLLLPAWGLGIARDAARLIIGKYNATLAVLVTALDAAALALCAIVFTNPALWNPELPLALRGVFGQDGEFIARAVTVFTNSFVWILVFAFAMDIGDTWVKTVRQAR